MLPVEGAPLVFSTSFAHDLVLHLNYPEDTKPDGEHPQDIPLTADAFHGGLALTVTPKRHALPQPDVATAASQPSAQTPATGPLTGTIRGSWGFDPFTGPTMPLQDVPGSNWRLVSDEPLISGKDRHVFLTSSGTGCVESIHLEPASGKHEKESWKPADKPNVIDVTLNAPAHDSGAIHLAIHQFGDANPATVSLVPYSEPAKLDALHFHAGDTAAVLVGTGLEQVRQAEFGGLTFKPTGEGSSSAPLLNGKSELHLALPADAKAPALPVGGSLTAKVALNDGRTLHLAITVERARPAVSLISKADVPASEMRRGQLRIRLTSEDDLPVGDALMFSLKSTQPFPRNGSVEISNADGSLHTAFSVDGGSLILEDPQTLLATLQPLKSLGSSAFGPIRLRAVAPDGTAGDWIPLITLVRLPTLDVLSCPVAAPPVSQRKEPNTATTVPPDVPTETPIAPLSAQPAAPPPMPCMLSGSSLYFIDSIAADESFANAVKVPAGFVGSSIAVPPPTGAVYYLRLRDDPTVTNTVTLPTGPL